METISVQAKHDLKSILIAEMGENAYNTMIEKLCKELHELKLRIEPLLKNPSDEIFRKELMREYILQLKNDDIATVKMTLCDIALDTILN